GGLLSIDVDHQFGITSDASVVDVSGAGCQADDVGDLRSQAGQDFLILALDTDLDPGAATTAELADRRGSHFAARDIGANRTCDLRQLVWRTDAALLID